MSSEFWQVAAGSLRRAKDTANDIADKVKDAAEDVAWDIYKSRSPEPTKHRNHHYTFDVDDNGVDINGFILHHNKHKGNRHKFRVYLDSNENGRFDKDDLFIGRSGIKAKHSKKGVGNLIDLDEIGKVAVKLKPNRDNASSRNAAMCAAAMPELFPLLESMTFNNAAGEQLAQVLPTNIMDHLQQLCS